MSQNKDAKLKFNMDAALKQKSNIEKELASVRNALFNRLSTSLKPK